MSYRKTAQLYHVNVGYSEETKFLYVLFTTSSYVFIIIIV